MNYPDSFLKSLKMVIFFLNFGIIYADLVFQNTPYIFFILLNFQKKISDFNCQKWFLLFFHYKNDKPSNASIFLYFV